MPIENCIFGGIKRPKSIRRKELLRQLFFYSDSGRAGSPVGALLPASPCFFVGPRQQRRRFPGARPFRLAPCSPQALSSSSDHANRGAVIQARGLPGWRLAPRKPLRLRQATPTEAPLSERAVFHVGALLPASPCAFVGPRQQRRRFPGTRPPRLAPCSPQALVPSSGHANRGAVIRARGLSCWRLAPRKPLRLRQATPTLAPFSQRAAFHVGAAFPASPCSFVGPRQPRRLFLGARPSMLAPCIPQALASSSDHANRGAVTPARGLFGSRLPAGKANEFGSRARTLERKEAEKQPGLRFGSRPPARKANEFGFRARTLEREGGGKATRTQVRFAPAGRQSQ